MNIRPELLLIVSYSPPAAQAAPLLAAAPQNGSKSPHKTAEPASTNGNGTDSGTGAAGQTQISSRVVVPGPQSATHVIVDDKKKKKCACCVIQ